MDIVVQARSGLMVANGRTTDGRPVSGDPVAADYMCSMSMAFGVAAALLQRTVTGEGAEVHGSLMQAAMTLNNNQMLRVESVDGPIHEESRRELAGLRERGASYAEQRMAQPSARARIMADIYFRTYTTADGWLAVACGSPRLRAAFSRAIGLEDHYSGDDPNNHEAHYEDLRVRAEAIVLERLPPIGRRCWPRPVFPSPASCSPSSCSTIPRPPPTTCSTTSTTPMSARSASSHPRRDGR